MLTRADLTGTRPLGQIEAPTPTSAIADARQESFNRFAQIAIGKQFQADILSRLNDGTFLVRIADTVARMNLPAGTRVGESITATLVSADPKPTFLVGPQTNLSTATLSTTGQLVDRFLQMVPEEEMTLGAGKALSPNPAVDSAAVGKTALEGVVGKTAIVPTAVEAQPAAASPSPPSSTPTSLSSAGRLIDSIIQTAQQSGAPTTLVGKAPLVFSAAASAPQVATALQHALVSSGLFYESHVAQWVNGERPAADLMREPQAKPGHVLPTTAAPPQAQVEDARPPANPLSEVQAQAANAKPADAESVILANALSPDATRMINLQLAALENQRVMWQGELWPGQAMEWEVSRDAPQKDGEEAPPTWKSAVRFELPTLGLVSATIHMVGEHVSVQIRTASETTATALRAHGGELASALDAAGSPLDSLMVKQDGTV